MKLIETADEWIIEKDPLPLQEDEELKVAVLRSGDIKLEYAKTKDYALVTSRLMRVRYSKLVFTRDMIESFLRVLE